MLAYVAMAKKMMTYLRSWTMICLKGKVAFITGASSGIGAATAKQFAELKCKLALNGRNEEALKEVAQQCQTLGCGPNDVLVLVGDVTDSGLMSTLVDKAITHFSKIDILVNNAGTVAIGDVQTTSLETWNHVISTNCTSAFMLSKLVTPHLIMTKGCIVNVSSVNGLRPAPDVVAYSVSKAALDQLTQCLALELAGHGVRVNSVNPGIIATPLQMRAGLTNEQYEKFVQHQNTTHPLGRIGESAEVAKCIAWLASDAASFMTGVLLPVDGGRVIFPPPPE